MQISQLYCSHCGAANDKTALLCFACSSPLSQDAEKLEDTSALLNQRYRVLTSVGIGGFGTIYKVQDTQRANALFAIKKINLINLSTTQIIEATEAFHREVRMLSSLHHENLPRIYDSFTDPQHWYMVMDFIEGETLEQYLAVKSMSIRSSGTPLIPLNEIIAIGMQLCSVLAYLHKQQPSIIFRDLKPANIMRTAQGHLFLIDFGIARQFKPGKAQDTLPLGSPGYAPPEQYGKAQTTPAADIYSFGVLLHQFLSGEDPSEHPFQFAPLRMYGGSDFVELEALIERMIHMQAEQRPMIDDVKEVFQRLQIHNHLQPSLPGNIFSVPQQQGTGARQNPSGNTLNPSLPMLQQSVFPQQNMQPAQQQLRRRFILALGAVTLFGAGWLASSELSRVISQAARSGSAAGSVPPDTTQVSNSPNVNWIFEIGGLTAQPAVASGMVYAVSSDWSLYAVDATSGQQKWSFAITDSVTNTPLIANGIVYVVSENTNIFAIDAISGHQKWSSSIVGGDLYISTIANGIVYISSNDGNVYAVDATSGQKKWSFQNSSILTVVNDVVYGSLNDGSLYAVDATSGQKKWSFLSSNFVDASFPLAVANDVVYIGSFEGNIYAIDVETGRKKWAFQTGNAAYGMPAVVDGIVYVGSNDRSIYAIDVETGRKKWAFQTDNAVQAPPAVINGVVYVGSFDKNVYAIDAMEGKMHWVFATGGPVDYALTIVDAVIYVGSDDNNLYALTTP